MHTRVPISIHHQYINVDHVSVAVCPPVTDMMSPNCNAYSVNEVTRFTRENARHCGGGPERIYIRMKDVYAQKVLFDLSTCTKVPVCLRSFEV